MIKFNFLKRLREIFKGKKMSFNFENVKVKQLEDKINLKSTATNDGKNNLPRASSETFSNAVVQTTFSWD